MTLFWVGMLAAGALLSPSGQDGANSPPAAGPSTGLIHAPTVVQYLNVYPKAALAAKQNGKVGLHCLVEVDGALSHCTAVEETPTGKGFGAAALTLAPYFKLGPGPFQSGDVITIPLTWTPTGFAPAERAPLGTPWANRASAKDFLASFPEKARQAAKAGDAQLACASNPDGTLKDCVVRKESPDGYGFGKAALSMAPLFRLSPEGVPLPASATVSLSWTPSGEPGPIWISEPTSQEMAAAFPERAMRMEKTGHTEMHCKVENTGFLSNCAVVSENPQGYEFGAASLKLTPLFRMGLADGTIDPKAGSVTIPLNFGLR